jgi:hypothetical protein
VSPTEPHIRTVSEVVHRAVEVCDPEGTDDALADLLSRFVDDDIPVTAVEDIDELLAERKGAVDPQDEIPSVVMAVAVAAYLARRRDEVDDSRQDILRLAARAEFDGHPPEPVAAWLQAEGAVI